MTAVTAIREPELELIVRKRTTLAQEVVGLELGASHEKTLPRWEPGAHIDLVLVSGLVRQYSLCSDPRERDVWRIAVLREPNGRGGSAYVHDAVNVGTPLRVRGPRNKFPFLPANDYLFIAGGIGITPILQMVAAAQRAGARWQLVYGGRTETSMAFLEELADCGDRVLVRPQSRYGLLELDILLAKYEPGRMVYCCGPAPLLAAVEQRCGTWPPGSLHTERFSPVALREEAGSTAFDVVLNKSNITVHVPVGTSILRAIKAAGINVLSSCEEGTCGSCETTVLKGTIEHYDALLTADERAAGDLMMICVSRASSPQLTLNL